MARGFEISGMPLQGLIRCLRSYFRPYKVGRFYYAVLVKVLV
jgi:hypothetical protein